MTVRDRSPWLPLGLRDFAKGDWGLPWRSRSFGGDQDGETRFPSYATEAS